MKNIAEFTLNKPYKIPSKHFNFFDEFWVNKYEKNRFKINKRFLIKSCIKTIKCLPIKF